MARRTRQRRTRATRSALARRTRQHRARATRSAGQPVRREIATSRDGRDITRGYVDALPYLYPTDTVLQLQGGHNYALYEDVLRDDQVQAVFAQRRLAVVSRPTRVVPGGPTRRDRLAAAFIEQTLAHIRWDTVTDRMLYGRFYGYSVAECLWGRDGKYVTLERLAVRNRRRFVFGPDSSLKLLTTTRPQGETLPERKFWVLSTGADNDDEPYGLGLAHWLYWPVLFKRHLARFWLIALEKFGQPTVIGKYPRGASEADIRSLQQAGEAVRTDTVATMPEDVVLELLESARSGRMDYAGFYDRLDAAIAKVVLGQTMTTDDGASLSQADVHFTVRQDIVAADARLISDSFNRSVVRWLTDWNFPGAAYPTVERDMDEAPDLKALAERDEIITRMTGKRPDDEYIEQTYGLKLVEPATGTPPDDTTLTEFAEAELTPLEQALDAIDAEDWESLANPLIQPILKQAKAVPDTLLADLAKLYPTLNTDALTQQLTQLLWVADTWGRLNAAGETDDA